MPNSFADQTPDESISYLFGSVIALLTVAIVLFSIIYFVYHLFWPSRAASQFFKKNQHVVEDGLILIHHLPFFKALDEAGKKLLIKNAGILFETVQFKQADGRFLDKSKAYQVSLTLALVALGLERKNHYGHLSSVVIHPEIFYSDLLEQNVKGLSLGKGIMHLSWSDFEHGWEHNDDRYNLGLHEAAHMLLICKYTHINSSYDGWTKVARQFIANQSINPIEKVMFRPYAITNLDEFWACCVEQFFEMPEMFSIKHPLIYQLTKSKLGH